MCVCVCVCVCVQNLFIIDCPSYFCIAQNRPNNQRFYNRVFSCELAYRKYTVKSSFWFVSIGKIFIVKKKNEKKAKTSR